MNREYVAAGSLAALTGLACIVEARVFPIAILPVFGVALLAVFYTLARMRSAADESGDDVGPHRPKAMAVLWYGMSTLLGASLLREPGRVILEGDARSVSTLSWVLAGVGLASIGAAIVGLVRLLLQRR